MKKFIAKELRMKHPGVQARYENYINAMLQGGMGIPEMSPDKYADFVVAVVNRIIEETEQ